MARRYQLLLLGCVAVVGCAGRRPAPVRPAPAPESRSFYATDREIFSAVLTSARSQDWILEIANARMGWVVARTPDWREPTGMTRAYWYFSIKEGVVSLHCRISVEKQGKWVDSTSFEHNHTHPLLGQQLTALERLLEARRTRW